LQNYVTQFQLLILYFGMIGIGRRVEHNTGNIFASLYERFF